jgi:hypothetical protein
MPKLSDNVKFFIVQGLACFDTPTQVSKAVKEEFGLEVPRPQIQLYDPTSIVGRALSKKYTEIFHSTRQQFLEEIGSIPIANQSFRLRALDQMYQRAIARGNEMLAKEVLEQAAKEAAGFYAGKQGAGAPNDSPLLEWLKQIGGTSIPIAHDIEGESRRVTESAVQDAEMIQDPRSEKQDKPKQKRLPSSVGRD